MGGGYCGPGQSACSLNEFNTTTVCPFSRQGRPGVPGQYRLKREAQLYTGSNMYGGEFQYCHSIGNHSK